MPGQNPAMKDMVNRKEGKVAPDTLGAEYFFLRTFITEDMDLDFSLIEDDFVKHCHGRLREFSQVQWYGYDSCRYSSPEEAHKRVILGLVLNGAKSGDPYCIGLLQYLYKTYHKQEYKQLKHFSRISAMEILSLAETKFGISYGITSRILVMCAINHVVMDEKCSLLYLMLDKKRQG